MAKEKVDPAIGAKGLARAVMEGLYSYGFREGAPDHEQMVDFVNLLMCGLWNYEDSLKGKDKKRFGAFCSALDDAFRPVSVSPEGSGPGCYPPEELKRVEDYLESLVK